MAHLHPIAELPSKPCVWHRKAQTRRGRCHRRHGGWPLVRLNADRSISLFSSTTAIWVSTPTSRQPNRTAWTGPLVAAESRKLALPANAEGGLSTAGSDKSAINANACRYFETFVRADCRAMSGMTLGVGALRRPAPNLTERPPTAISCVACMNLHFPFFRLLGMEPWVGGK